MLISRDTEPGVSAGSSVIQIRTSSVLVGNSGVQPLVELCNFVSLLKIFRSFNGKGRCQDKQAAGEKNDWIDRIVEHLKREAKRLATNPDRSSVFLSSFNYWTRWTRPERVEIPASDSGVNCENPILFPIIDPSTEEIYEIFSQLGSIVTDDFPIDFSLTLVHKRFIQSKDCDEFFLSWSIFDNHKSCSQSRRAFRCQRDMDRSETDGQFILAFNLRHSVCWTTRLGGLIMIERSITRPTSARCWGEFDLWKR